jgi:pimeloyl-ACP methyl ester carboxylesterase
MDAAASAAPTASGASPLPPLTAEESLFDLQVEGRLPSVAAVPVGVTERRPIAIIAHGMFGGPRGDCPMWRGILGGYVFVLCVRGILHTDQPKSTPPEAIQRTYASLDELQSEMDAGLAALRARFGAWMDERAPLLVGCSLGANFGAGLAIRDPARFPRVVLIEGGHDRWTPAAAGQFASGGGDRVLFLCGQESCFQAANAKIGTLRAAGVPAKQAHALGQGHSCHGAVAWSAKEVLPWLTEQDPRWLSGITP